MKKISLVGLALVAVCAFFALATTSAFAALEYALAEWLNNGLAITATTATDTVGSLKFENSSNKAEILCSGLFVGTVGSDGEDTVTEVFNLSGTKIAELDGSPATGGISCTGDNLCETGSEIWPINLPFLTLLQLDTENNKFYDLVLNNANGVPPAYNVNCKTIIGTVNELCVAVAESGGEVVNVTGGVEPVGKLEPFGACNGTAGVGVIEAVPGGLTTTNSGGPLSASE
jgi:hypothetical protein